MKRKLTRLEEVLRTAEKIDWGGFAIKDRGLLARWVTNWVLEAIETDLQIKMPRWR